MAGSMVATVVLLLLHVPPGVPFRYVGEVYWQTVENPTMVPGKLITA